MTKDCAHPIICQHIYLKEMVKLSWWAALETKYPTLKNVLTTKIDSFRFLRINVQKTENGEWSEAMSRSR